MHLVFEQIECHSCLEFRQGDIHTKTPQTRQKPTLCAVISILEQSTSIQSASELRSSNFHER